MTKISKPATGVLLCGPEDGRRYDMGLLAARFLADEDETDAGYSISEWILQPGQPGVGAHSHDANDEMFFVLSGNPDILTGDDWHTLSPGAFVRIPAGVTHDFRNRGDSEARLLNLFIPGGFERDMPKIVDWFRDNG
ncbi:cupin domain-containing protein [Pseudooceanicola sp.]|uniref:cupin domain-containing protein n=1 Tax=Pseudooceanicola sp. TaxID=1914328 RepID=UPI0035C6A847